MEIIVLIAIAVFGFDTLRELMVLRDIKSCFYCSNCNTFLKEFIQGDKCEKCHRTINVKGKTWDHLIIHRVNWIPTKQDRTILKWKEYKKLSLIEIAVDIGAMAILSLSLIIK